MDSDDCLLGSIKKNVKEKLIRTCIYVRGVRARIPWTFSTGSSKRQSLRSIPSASYLRMMKRH
jgi:hypothetical protein